MSTLRAYVLSETLKVFAVTMGACTLILTLAGCGKEAIRKGLPPYVLFELLPYLTLETLRFTLPGCLLFAVSSVFGRMAADNEFLALKSTGLSPMKLINPVLVLAFATSLGTFVTYDLSAGWARPGMLRIVNRAATDIVYGYLRSNKSYSDSQFSIVVKDVDGDRLSKPIIVLHDEQNGTVQLVAREARVKLDPSNGVVRFHCTDGEVSFGDDTNFAFKDHWSQDFKILPTKRIDENWVSPSWLRNHKLRPQIAREKRIIAHLEQSTAARKTLSIDIHRERLFRLEAEGQRRLANGFGCFCFAMIGIPVALWLKSAETFSVFFACFAPILIVYYPLLVFGETMARQGVVPQLTVWLANIVLLLCGSILLYRVLRR